MEKKLGLIACMLILVPALSAGTITVTTPQNGVTYCFEPCCGLGVKWTYSGIPDSTTVKVLLFQNGVYKAHLQTGIPITKKLYYPPLPSPIPSGGGYKIRVQTEGAPEAALGKSGTFFWYPARLVNLFPPGQEDHCWLLLNSKRVIRWFGFGESAFVPHTCRLVLKRNGVEQGVIADNIACPSYKGYYTYEWTVGKLLNGQVPVGAGYSIRVVFKPATGGEFSGEWSTFSIVSQLRPKTLKVRKKK